MCLKHHNRLCARGFMLIYWGLSPIFQVRIQKCTQVHTPCTDRTSKGLVRSSACSPNLASSVCSFLASSHLLPFKEICLGGTAEWLEPRGPYRTQSSREKPQHKRHLGCPVGHCHTCPDVLEAESPPGETWRSINPPLVPQGAGGLPPTTALKPHALWTANEACWMAALPNVFRFPGVR